MKIEYDEKSGAWGVSINDLSLVFFKIEENTSIGDVKERFLERMNDIFEETVRAAFQVKRAEPNDPYNLHCRMEDTEDSEGNVC